MDKHSSLLWKVVSYGRKKFYNIGTWFPGVDIPVAEDVGLLGIHQIGLSISRIWKFLIYSNKIAYLKQGQWPGACTIKLFTAVI
jgi:hypothetical protein